MCCSHYYGREAGLELREDIDTVLEPGMVVSMEPMITIPEGQPGAGGYREHDILVVGRTAPRTSPSSRSAPSTTSWGSEAMRSVADSAGPVRRPSTWCGMVASAIPGAAVPRRATIPTQTT